MAPDSALAFVGGPCCLTLDFVFALWIMITFYTLLTSLFCMPKRDKKVYWFALCMEDSRLGFCFNEIL
jgi:hypothetical protein